MENRLLIADSITIFDLEYKRESQSIVEPRLALRSAPPNAKPLTFLSLAIREILFIALSEYWNRALITAYMATFAVGVSAILGITVGSICARNDISTKFILGICDFFQTFA